MSINIATIENKYYDNQHNKELIVSFLDYNTISIDLWRLGQDIDKNPDCLSSVSINLQTNKITINHQG
jgi:hypothetical protein